MRHEWEELDDEVAAGAICPMSECGALVIAYRSPDRTERDNAESWEFVCGRCVFEFVVPEGELAFQSVPKDWLLAKAV